MDQEHGSAAAAAHTVHVSWCRPGCFPDNAPAIFHTFEEARRYLVDELIAAADDAVAWAESPTSERLAQDLTATADELQEATGPEFIAKIAGFVWLIDPCEDGDSCELGDGQ
jgi:hypothetical protein